MNRNTFHNDFNTMNNMSTESLPELKGSNHFTIVAKLDNKGDVVPVVRGSSLPQSLLNAYKNQLNQGEEGVLVMNGSIRQDDSADTASPAYTLKSIATFTNCNEMLGSIRSRCKKLDKLSTNYFLNAIAIQGHCTAMHEGDNQSVAIIQTLDGVILQLLLRPKTVLQKNVGYQLWCTHDERNSGRLYLYKKKLLSNVATQADTILNVSFAKDVFNKKGLILK